MRQFDALLRQGLMDANLAQYENLLERADGREADFSPRYRRERMRLLADPWGWERRQPERPMLRRGRLDWRIAAIVAALLLLSACGYAIVTGQFTDWFPRLGFDQEHPESSEEALARMGTVIEERQTVNGAAVTLHGAVWDGYTMSLSLSVQGANLPPEEIHSKTWIYAEECSVQLPDDQREAYVREEQIAHGHTGTELEERTQTFLEAGNPWINPVFRVADWDEETDTALLQLTFLLQDYLEHPELHLHIENLATYEKDKGHFVGMSSHGQRFGPGPDIPLLAGPYDFTFVPEKLTPPLWYSGEVELVTEQLEIPIRITSVGFSPLRMWANYETLVPVDFLGDDPDESKLDADAISDANAIGILGLWMEDGSYVEYPAPLTSSMSPYGSDGPFSNGRVGGMMNGAHPHAIDPASVTAVNISGTRVELSDLEPVQEETE